MTTRKSQSNKIILKDRMGRLARSCRLISKRGIKEKTDQSTKGTKRTYTSKRPNDTLPLVSTQPYLDEIDELAQQWCRLVMDQVQETRSRQQVRSAFSEKTIENISSTERKEAQPLQDLNLFQVKRLPAN